MSIFHDQASLMQKARQQLHEKAVNPYAVGMSAAMKATGDKPPLEKSTITKAHEIAKKVEKAGYEPEGEQLDEAPGDGYIMGTGIPFPGKRAAQIRKINREYDDLVRGSQDAAVGRTRVHNPGPFQTSVGSKEYQAGQQNPGKYKRIQVNSYQPEGEQLDEIPLALAAPLVVGGVGLAANAIGKGMSKFVDTQSKNPNRRLVTGGTVGDLNKARGLSNSYEPEGDDIQEVKLSYVPPGEVEYDKDKEGNVKLNRKNLMKKAGKTLRTAIGGGRDRGSIRIRFGEETEINEGKKELKQRNKNEMQRKAGNLGREVVSTPNTKKNAPKRDAAMNRMKKLVSVIARDDEEKRFKTIGQSPLHNSYEPESELVEYAQGGGGSAPNLPPAVDKFVDELPQNIQKFGKKIKKVVTGEEVISYLIDNGFAETEQNALKIMENMSESWAEQIDEKCWPGYKKKGMKTMFGKRYPNCVKKEEVEVIDERRREDKGTPRKPRDRAFELVAQSMGSGKLGVQPRGVKKDKGAPTPGPSMTPAQKVAKRRADAEKAQDMYKPRAGESD